MSSNGILLTHIGNYSWKYKINPPRLHSQSGQFWKCVVGMARPLLRENEHDKFIRDSTLPQVHTKFEGEWQDRKMWYGPFMMSKSCFIEITNRHFSDRNPVIFEKYDFNSLQNEVTDIINYWKNDELKICHSYIM